MNDSEAWTELVGLYLGECDYAKASYCVEELILAHPRDHLFFQLFGEVHKNRKTLIHTLMFHFSNIYR